MFLLFVHGKLIFHLILMYIFVMNSLGKSLSEKCVALLCNYYPFWHLKDNFKFFTLIFYPILKQFFFTKISSEWNIDGQLKKIPEILLIWKAYLTFLIVRKDKCPKYTCSTFPCQHTAVVSCFALHSPLFLVDILRLYPASLYIDLYF